MKVKKTGTVYEVLLEGPIGEGSALFNHDVRDASRIVIDGEKMTFINSIGVKNWILWTVRIPAKAAFVLQNLPLVMINQASMVRGFLPRHARIESLYAPYACDACGAEKNLRLTPGAGLRIRNGLNPKKGCPTEGRVSEMQSSHGSGLH